MNLKNFTIQDLHKLREEAIQSFKYPIVEEIDEELKNRKNSLHEISEENLKLLICWAVSSGAWKILEEVAVEMQKRTLANKVNEG